MASSYNMPPVGDYLNNQERSELVKKNDLLALFWILKHIFICTAAFSLVYYIPNPLTIIVALCILGGRQLACAVLMHDAGHHSMFSNNRLNKWVGNWLGGYLVFQDVEKYGNYHLEHHLHTGLDEDPDILLTRGYPTSRSSMYRKVIRDLTGQTGIRALTGLILMHLGYLKYNLGKKVVHVDQSNRTWQKFGQTVYRELSGVILAHLLLITLLSVTIGPVYYLLWIGAYLTTFQFCIRVRSIAEHSMVEDPKNALANTRTTYANWLEQLFFAPLNVNYHLEHHMLMGVPFYNLPRMHRILLDKGFYEVGILEKSYWDVLKKTVIDSTTANP